MSEGLTLENARVVIAMLRVLEATRHLQSDVIVAALRKHVESFTVTRDTRPAEAMSYLEAKAALKKYDDYAADLNALEDSLNQFSRTIQPSGNDDVKR